MAVLGASGPERLRFPSPLFSPYEGRARETGLSPIRNGEGSGSRMVSWRLLGVWTRFPLSSPYEGRVREHIGGWVIHSTIIRGLCVPAECTPFPRHSSVWNHKSPSRRGLFFNTSKHFTVQNVCDCCTKQVLLIFPPQERPLAIYAWEIVGFSDEQKKLIARYVQ